MSPDSSPLEIKMLVLIKRTAHFLLEKSLLIATPSLFAQKSSLIARPSPFTQKKVFLIARLSPFIQKKSFNRDAVLLFF